MNAARALNWRRHFLARRAPAGQDAKPLPSVPEAATVEAAVEAITPFGGEAVTDLKNFLKFKGELAEGGQGAVAAVQVTRREDNGVMLPPPPLLRHGGDAVGRDKATSEAVIKLTRTVPAYGVAGTQYLLRALMLRVFASCYMPLAFFINVVWHVTITMAMLLNKHGTAVDTMIVATELSPRAHMTLDVFMERVSVPLLAAAVKKTLDKARAKEEGKDETEDEDENEAEDDEDEDEDQEGEEDEGEDENDESTVPHWRGAPGLPPGLVYWAMRVAVFLLMGGKMLWDSGMLHRDLKPKNVLVFVGILKERLGWVMTQIADLGQSRPADPGRIGHTRAQFGTPGCQPVLSLIDVDVLGDPAASDLQLDITALADVVLSTLVNRAVVMDCPAAIGPTWLLYVSLYSRADKLRQPLLKGDRITVEEAPLAVLGVELAGDLELLALLDLPQHPPVLEDAADKTLDTENTVLLLKLISRPGGETVMWDDAAGGSAPTSTLAADAVAVMEAGASRVGAAAQAASEQVQLKLARCGTHSDEVGVSEGLRAVDEDAMALWVQHQQEQEQQEQEQHEQEQHEQEQHGQEQHEQEQHEQEDGLVPDEVEEYFTDRGYGDPAELGMCALNARRYIGTLSFPQPHLHRSHNEAGSIPSVVVNLMGKLADSLELVYKQGGNLEWRRFPKLDVAAAVKAALAGQPAAAAASSSRSGGGAAAAQAADLAAAISVVQLLLQLFLLALKLWLWAVEQPAGLTAGNLEALRRAMRQGPGRDKAEQAVQSWVKQAQVRAVATARSLVLLMLKYQQKLHQGKALPLLYRIVGGLGVAKAQAATNAAAAANTDKATQPQSVRSPGAPKLSKDQEAAKAMSNLVEQGLRCTGKVPGSLLWLILLNRSDRGAKKPAAEPPAKPPAAPPAEPPAEPAAEPAAAISAGGAGGGGGGSGAGTRAGGTAQDSRKRQQAGGSSESGGGAGAGARAGAGFAGGDGRGNRGAGTRAGGTAQDNRKRQQAGGSSQSGGGAGAGAGAGRGSGGSSSASDGPPLLFLGAQAGVADVRRALPSEVTLELLRVRGILTGQQVLLIRRAFTLLRGPGNNLLAAALPVSRPVVDEVMRLLQMLRGSAGSPDERVLVGLLQACLETDVTKSLTEEEQQQLSDFMVHHLSVGVAGLNAVAMVGQRNMVEAQARQAQKPKPVRVPKDWRVKATTVLPGYRNPAGADVAAADVAGADPAGVDVLGADAAGAAAAGGPALPPAVSADKAEPSAVSSPQVTPDAALPPRPDRIMQELHRQMAELRLSSALVAGSGGPSSYSAGAGSSSHRASSGAASSSTATANPAAAIRNILLALRPGTELASGFGTHQQATLERLLSAAQAPPPQAQPLTRDVEEAVLKRLSQQQQQQQPQGVDGGADDMDVDEQQQPAGMAEEEATGMDGQPLPRRRQRREEPQ